ncbi:MAG TPA: hypothetical protein VH459_09365 [Gaiellales bacterium]
MTDHLRLTVSDYAASRDLCRAALAPLGYSLVMEAALGVGGLDASTPAATTPRRVCHRRQD